MTQSLDDLGTERIINENMGAAKKAQQLIRQATVAPETRTVSVPTGQVSPATGQPLMTQTQQTVLAPKPMNLGEVVQLRRDLGNQIDATNNPAERSIILQMKNALDRHVDEAATSDVLSGDPTRLQQLRDAMGASRDKFDFWGPQNRVAARFMDQMRNGELSGQQVFNAIYGAGQLSGAGPSTQILDALRQRFGTNSQLWQDTQAAGVTRMLFGSFERAAEMTPAAIDKRITEALRGNGREVFQQLGVDPAGLEQLQGSLRALQQSQTKNPSGTGADVAQLIRSYAKSVPFVGKAIEAGVERQALRATGGGGGARLSPGLFPRLPPSFGDIAGSAGGGLLGPSALPLLGR